MARPKSPDGRRVPVSYKLTEAERDLVDSLRGETERGVWLREAALLVARKNSGIPQPERKTKPRASAAPPVVLREPEPEPARKTAARPRTGQQGESAPKSGNCKHPRVHGKGVCPDCFTYVASKS
jgi:hypothetical protein